MLQFDERFLPFERASPIDQNTLVIKTLSERVGQ
jgi:hypothetical protein